ncbi:transposase (fragment) [Desulforamulus hydrothermalis Lam5 = DSM 18033]|uniref:Transposase n=2 Tax=Desulforamulus TaxID=2916693 RepID=K8DY82_9FIRM
MPRGLASGKVERPLYYVREQLMRGLEEEKARLLKIPYIEPALLQFKEPRRVSNDGYISYEGNLYPVPMRYCTKRVWTEIIYGRRMKIYEEAGKLLS